MYEMEGPLLATAALVAGYPAAVRHATATGRVPPRRAPVSRLPPRPGPSSGADTSSVVSAVLLPPPRSTQGLCDGNSKILWSSTGHLPFIPCAPSLSTALSTQLSTACGFRLRG